MGETEVTLYYRYSKTLKKNVPLVNMPTPIKGIHVYYAVNGAKMKRLPVAPDMVEALEVMAGWLADRHVASIYTLGTYNDRPVRGGAAPSAHASGEAIDIRKFYYTVKVETPVGVQALPAGWGTERGKAFWTLFCQAMRRRNAGPFATVLGPDNSKTHQDHVHCAL